MKPPSSNQVSEYRRDGHLIMRGLIPREVIADLRRHVLELCRPHQERLKPMKDRDVYGKAFVQVMHLWEQDPAIRPISLSADLGRVVADLFGVDRVRIYHDQALLKEPGGGHTPWHQDNWYIPFDTQHILTMWVPLVDCTSAMGTMSFASGSHTAGMQFQGGTSDESQASLDRVIQERGWAIAHSGDMSVGDASFHDGWTIHSAGANQGHAMRESFVIVYYADGARLIERGPWQGAIGYHLPGQKPGDLAGTDAGNPVVFAR